MDIVGFLMEQSDNLLDVAKRCADPRIAAELVSVAELLHAKAEQIKRLN